MNRKKILGWSGLFAAAGIALLLSSCVKTYDLVPSETFQGDEHPDKRAVVADNLRSVRVYNEWETAAMFDVLWMSDDTRRVYADSYCVRRGKDKGAYDMMVKKELEKGDQMVEFYVLADVRDRNNPELSDKNPAWTMSLDVGGTRVQPSSIKEVELEPEIFDLFGHRFLREKFKTPYLVRFPKRDLAKKPFKMIFSSVTRQCELGWQGAERVLVVDLRTHGEEKGRLPKDEDYYWL